MDHETALQAANQALSSGSSSTGRFSTLELRGMNDSLHDMRRPLDIDESPRLPRGAWEIAAMLSVALATLLVVIGLWFL